MQNQNLRCINNDKKPFKSFYKTTDDTKVSTQIIKGSIHENSLYKAAT